LGIGVAPAEFFGPSEGREAGARALYFIGPAADGASTAFAGSVSDTIGAGSCRPA